MQAHVAFLHSTYVGCIPCRRGAAFGLAGIVKGLGVSAINGYGVLDALKQALDDQGSAEAREGALFAFEALCEKLGRCTPNM